MLLNPQLRDDLDIQLIDQGSSKLIYLSCKIGVSEPLALISEVGPIIMMLDGSRSLDQIKDHFLTLGVNTEIVDRVVELLDQNLYLNSPSFLHNKQKILEEFSDSKIRPAAHAGRVYPDNAEELNNYIKSITDPEPFDRLEKAKADNLIALVAPHIDYRRGFSAYAKAYAQLREQSPDICILIGTSHQAGQNLFQLCNKAFSCPNGTLEIHQEFFDSLLNSYGAERALADEFLHKHEHSLELQLPFLNYFCPNTKIIPILVSGFYPYLRKAQPPSSDSQYSDFIKALSETITKFRQQGLRIIFVAGVDMAHVGEHFGDRFSVDDSRQAEIKIKDNQYLESISALSSAAMFEHVAKDMDSRRICGFSSMHSILDVLTLSGKKHDVNTLTYQQALDAERKCLVSFASIAIYETHL